MFAKDALFAKLTLSDDEYRLYAQMHAPIAAQLREPDLVVWLQASAPTLLARVRRRSGAAAGPPRALRFAARVLRQQRRRRLRLTGGARSRDREDCSAHP